MPKQKQQPNLLFTRDELKVIRLVCEGYTIRETADKLKVTRRMAEVLRTKVFQKLKVDAPGRFAVEAVRRGLYNTDADTRKVKFRNQKSLFTKQELTVLRLISNKQSLISIAQKMNLNPYAMTQLMETIQKKIAETLRNESFPPILTKEEIEIIRLTCRGYRVDEIARKLGDTKRSVQEARQLLYKKVMVTNAASLAVYAIRNGIYKI